MSAPIKVIKRNGEEVIFDDKRVIHSMERVGVPHELFDHVLAHIKERVQQDDTITTDEIFYHIREFLTHKDKKSALRFNLRQAIFELGPSGFPFEQYLAKIFSDQGYKTQTDVIMQGECVSHEIDVLLEKDGKRDVVEAKFHNQTFGKTDVQVILYTYARYLDVSSRDKIDGVWVATNTKLTTDAITYAECKGVKVLAWNYPHQGNLQDFVETRRMYPITIMTDLTSEEKTRLINNGIVLVTDLLDVTPEEFETKYMIDRDRIAEIKNSADLLTR